jgi:4'-phosphopantetheinyl transferase
MSLPATVPEVWLIDVRRAGEAALELEAAAPRLSTEEHTRASGLGRDDGHRWLALRIVLRVLLERHVGSRLRGAPLTRGANGRPCLPWPCGIEFSLSHSGPFGLIAIDSSAVGVDIEQVRAVRFPGPRHAAIIGAAAVTSPDGRGEGVPSPLQAWVRLEAWGKARGSGVGALLQEIGVGGVDRARLSPDDCARTAAELIQRESFEVVDLELPAGLQGAICCRPVAAAIPVNELPADLEGIASVAIRLREDGVCFPSAPTRAPG